MCVQDASAHFAATVSEGATDAMYIALKQAIAGHSPTIVPPASKPLVLAGPFGAACHKGELLRWLLREYGDKLALPEMVTTKARGNAADTSPTFKVKSTCWLGACCWMAATQTGTHHIAGRRILE